MNYQRIQKTKFTIELNPTFDKATYNQAITQTTIVQGQC